MARETTLQLINQSVAFLLDYVRHSRRSADHVRPRDVRIFREIHLGKDGRITMSELASRLNLTPAATTQIVAGYEKKGWVLREHSQTDRRTVYVRLSDELQAKMHQFWQDHQKKIIDFLDYLGPEEEEHLERILEKVLTYHGKEE